MPTWLHGTIRATMGSGVVVDRGALLHSPQQLSAAIASAHEYLATIEECSQCYCGGDRIPGCSCDLPYPAVMLNVNRYRERMLFPTITTGEMELAIVRYFNPRVNLLVPRVSWGVGIHECDLLMITKAGYATEIEIKVSATDMVADTRKKHAHADPRIKYLYFAIPDYLLASMQVIPERAGILVAHRSSNYNLPTIRHHRDPQLLGSRKWTEKEIAQVARLGALRIWSLSQSLVSAKALLLANHKDRTDNVPMDGN